MQPTIITTTTAPTVPCQSCRGTGEHRPTPLADLTTRMERIPGVLAVTIIPGPSGRAIAEIHVEADLSRAPKMIARDIESVYLNAGHQLNYRKISIAPLGAPGGLTQRYMELIRLARAVVLGHGIPMVSLCSRDHYHTADCCQMTPDELAAREAFEALRQYLERLP